MLGQNGCSWRVGAILLSLAISRPASALADATPSKTLPGAEEGGASQDADTDDFQNQIQALGSSNDPEKVQKLVDEVEAAGKVNKDANYYHKVSELCNALFFSEGMDPKRGEIARGLAREAYNSPGEKPLFAEVDLVVFLQADFDVVDGLDGGDEWRQERLRRLQSWVAAWQRLQAAKKKLPPGGIYMIDDRQGLEPMLQDPVRRKKYEQDWARNAEIGRINTQRAEVDRLERALLGAIRFYTVSPYGRPPFDAAELEKALADTDLDKKLQDGFVAEVKKEEAAAHQKTLNDKPLTMRFIEVPPPGNAVYNTDPRFRKLVAFQVSSPLVEDILGKLREGTGVFLTRADDIQNEYPAAGSLFFGGTPAWKVMNIVAESRFVEGRWEKDGDGYRLVRNGNPVAPPEINEFAQAPPSPGWEGPARMVAVAVTVAIIGVLAFLLIRRKRLATT